jgi:hypothetical protein
MALKKKITKEEHAKLSEHFKAEYVEDGDGFKLDLEGEEDTGALKRAKDREAQLRKDAEKKLRETEEKLNELEGNDARKRGDIDTLEKSWKEKLTTQKSEYQAKLDKLSAHTTKTLVDNVALSIATKISSAPALILPHIRARLKADFEGDEPMTRVLDSAGKPSALTVDELSAEFVANKDFASVILASKASGSAGRASGSAPSNSSAPPQNADLSTMKPSQLAEHLRSIKAGN